MRMGFKYIRTRAMLVLLFCLVFTEIVCAIEHRPRERRGILTKWFGSDKTSDSLKQPLKADQQMAQYPIWRVHKYNGINLNPMPVTLVPKYQSKLVAASMGVYESPETNPKLLMSTSQKPTSNQFKTPMNMVPKDTTKSQEDIQGILKLLGVTDPSQVPTIAEVMEMIGASSEDEAIQAVKEIAATEYGIGLIKSFIESRQLPEENPHFAVATKLSTTSTTAKPATPRSSEVKNPIAPGPFTTKVASRLDNFHTNTHLVNRILSQQPVTDASYIGNTLGNLRKFFSYQDNTKIALDSYTEKQEIPTVVHVNEPIAPLNDPRIPNLSKIPDLSAFEDNPVVHQIPQLQLPSHFTIPRGIVQVPYMQVKYPHVLRHPTFYSYRGHPIVGNVPAAPATVFSKSSSELSAEHSLKLTPKHQATVKSESQRHRVQTIPLSLSTRNAFQNAPRIESSLPVPSLPYTFDEKPDVAEEFSLAANSPVESIALPENELQPLNIKEEVEIREARGPQRSSGFEAYATGKVHRANNVDVVQDSLINSGIVIVNSKTDT